MEMEKRVELCGVELGCSADKTERECRFENKRVEIHK